jgi:lysophospholipase L1-like esterase
MVQQNTHLKWYKDIMTFKEADKNSFPPPNEIVFVGSSSIRLWPHIKSYFPGYPIIQRGFGGAVFGDISNYRTDIITAYKPKQVVIYCGDNDIAAGKKSSQVLQLFTTLFNQIRKENPHARITAISIKPSIVLWSHCSTIENSNRLIKNYLAGQPNTSFVDVYSHMLTWNPKYPRKELYQSDGLHLTLKGYELWAGAVRSDLMK